MIDKCILVNIDPMAKQESHPWMDITNKYVHA
jgi:hypothetical protein